MSDRFYIIFTFQIDIHENNEAYFHIILQVILSKISEDQPSQHVQFMRKEPTIVANLDIFLTSYITENGCVHSLMVISAGRGIGEPNSNSRLLFLYTTLSH